MWMETKVQYLVFEDVGEILVAVWCVGSKILRCVIIVEGGVVAQVLRAGLGMCVGYFQVGTYN